MASSLPNTMLLRQRYLIHRVLGQGGFARTYFASDQERFQESCVIKEFVVSYQDESLISKAKDLFHREASILHQIQHPQIPRFWAAFEEDNRLFLVQDYVKGDTYRSILSQRKKEDKQFSETEVLHLLANLLPVLSYLHDRNIVHRDIAPDNIILSPHVTGIGSDNASPQGLPVLIDFGSVKEATSGLALVSSMTRVGKIGYAPPEQLQTGNVKPHSDLYSLAATCLVLLTGREPSSLLNSQTLEWEWEAHANISGPLAKILRKMLFLHPGDRYPTARRVWLDLLPILGDQAPVTQMLMDPKVGNDIVYTNPLDSSHDTSIYPDGSDWIWFSRSVTTLQSGEASRSLSLNLISPRMAIIGSILALLGMGTVIFRGPMPSTSAQLLQNKSVVESAGSVLVPNPGEPAEILFNAGEMSKIVTGNLQGNSTQVYTLKALRGQIMSVSLNGSSVLMNITRANGTPLESSSIQTRSWTGTLPADDIYSVRVSGTGVHALDISVTPLNREVNVQTQRLKFATGRRGTTVTGELNPKHMKRYIIKSQNNKMMLINGVLGDVTVSLISPHGDRIGGTSVQSNSWQGRLPMDGDYVVEVSADKRKSDYSLSVEIY
ncbi:MAG: serine/threonine-protein kinase [Cyanobacteria bacterium]|nr:serine/threonine-protein kinase [Cyanobacteriota bacterium]